MTAPDHRGGAGRRRAEGGPDGGPGGGPAVVACGGGHGLAATLTALRHLTEDLTAVVTVADDGGSSGRLRSELGVLPPGDLRMALAALCGDDEWGRTWARVLQHRFDSEGPLHGHAVGNLLISALWQQLGDAVEGLDLVARLLGARGRVLPMSSVPLSIEADVDGDDGPWHVVSGQASVATTSGRVHRVRLVPPSPPARPEVLEAVRAADWVVLGPGSWFTSVIPHLLVPGLAEAITTTDARRALVMNLSAPAQESSGMSAADHLRALREHAPHLRLDVVVADPVVLTAADHAGVELPVDVTLGGTVRPPVVDEQLLDDLAAEAERVGARLALRSLSAGIVPVHDPLRLAAALRDAFDGVSGQG